MLRAWGVKHPTLSLEEGALVTLRFGGTSCHTLIMEEIGGTWGVYEEPLVLE